jgi:tetratricopeptide (TPR) repeat protein
MAAAYSGRGDVLAKRGDDVAALRDFDAAIRLRPDFAPAYYSRGRSYMQLGELSKARADLSEALRLDPKLEAAQRQLESSARKEAKAKSG